MLQKHLFSVPGRHVFSTVTFNGRLLMSSFYITNQTKGFIYSFCCMNFVIELTRCVLIEINCNARECFFYTCFSFQL